jgi:hypothetical protein
MSRLARIKQADVRRLLEAAAKASGNWRFEVLSDGTIISKNENSPIANSGDERQPERSGNSYQASPLHSPLCRGPSQPYPGHGLKGL